MLLWLRRRGRSLCDLTPMIEVSPIAGIIFLTLLFELDDFNLITFFYWELLLNVSFGFL